MAERRSNARRHQCETPWIIGNDRRTLRTMRGGLERWKRGGESRGIRHAISYALEGTCDAHMQHSTGAAALEHYSDSTVQRFVVENGAITPDELSTGGLRVWLSGNDPITGRSAARP